MSRFEAVSSDAGSLSLHACAVIMALALIAASALSVVHAALAYRTEPSPGPGRAAHELLHEALRAWDDDDSPMADSFHDEGMKTRRIDGASLAVRDLSGSLHPEWADPAIFAQPALASFLQPGFEPMALDALRHALAPSRLMSDSYGRFFTDEAFHRILTGWAFPSPGAFRTPVASFLRWADDLPDRPAGALSVLDAVEGARDSASEVLRRIHPGWTRWIPAWAPLNANTAEGSLIAAILSWTGCPRGDAAAAAILARRETAELDEGRLSAILASFGTAGTSCTDDSRPWIIRGRAVLGCRSLFREYRIAEGQRSWIAVAGRSPGPEEPGPARLLCIDEEILP